MCHEQFHRARNWDRPSESVDEAADERADESLPSFLADEEPDDELEVLTDGGDE